MKKVVIESPYAANQDLVEEFMQRKRCTRAQAEKHVLMKNIEYLRACMHDSLMRGEAPYASHALYTQPGVLDDTLPQEREHGMRAGFVWRDAADKTVVYADRGVSRGMEYGIEHAEETGHPVEYRKLGGKWLRIQKE